MTIAATSKNSHLRQLRDRVVASDPGLRRLQGACSAALSMTTTIVLEIAVARAMGRDQKELLVAVLLGTMVAMLGSNALAGSSIRDKLRTGLGIPVAFGTGILVGAAAAHRPDVMLVLFVPVVFLAVWVRRFGIRYFFYGFMLWTGFFFTGFLHATLEQVPAMLLTVVIATAWLVLLSCTVLRTDPRRTITRLRRVFYTEVRAITGLCGDWLILEAEDVRRRDQVRRSLGAHRIRLAESALMMEGWATDDHALDKDWSGPALRRRLLDAQLLVDEIASSAARVAQQEGSHRHEAAAIARAAAGDDWRGAADLASRLLATERDGGDDAEARQLAMAVRELSAFALLSDPAAVSSDDEFTPAAALVLNGALPGSVSVAKNVPSRGRYARFSRMRLSTRQAVQASTAAGIALLAGHALSPTRYYWAVIVAFIAFAGTATRSETFIKATNRVVGTVAGLVVGVLLAHLTAGHTVWTIAVIVLSMSLGTYLVQLSYAYMIFFISIMVSQLYSQLHELSASLLVLRMEETAIGAVVGIAVGLLVLPTSTRDTVAAARVAYLDAVLLLLESVADALDPVGDPVPVVDVDALTRNIDLLSRQMHLVARPLTRGWSRTLVRGNDPRVVRHRLTAYATLNYRARRLALVGRRPQALEPPVRGSVAKATRSAAEVVRLLRDRAPEDTFVPQPLRAALADLQTATDGLTSGDCSTRTPARVAHNQRLLMHVLQEIANRPGRVAPVTTTDSSITKPAPTTETTVSITDQDLSV